MASSVASARRSRNLGVLVTISLIGILMIPDAVLGTTGPSAQAPKVSAATGESAWSEVAGRGGGGGTPALQLDEFKAYQLNKSALEGALNNAPLARDALAAGQGGLTVSLPSPTGEFQAFSLWESPVMEPGLAAKHPDISTFRGRGIDDPTASIRADISNIGFHASVRQTTGAWYIDPYYLNDQSLYASYYGRDLENGHGVFVERDANGQEVTTDRATYHPADTVTLTGESFAPNANVDILITDPQGNFADRSLATQTDASGGFETTFAADPDGHLDMHSVFVSDGVFEAGAAYQVISNEDTSVDPPTGDILRTYRLALITDPGYATYFGGPANVTANKVALMNRVNQIYEDDMSIHMTLVANNDLLNLDTWDLATAPNGPCGAAACFTQSQVTGCSSTARARFVIGQIIGASNYDAGHLALGQPGGGVANLGVMGRSNKAGGCTGIPTPTGDFYAVDYVAHEMGHQFSGNHTFNGTQLNCSGGNRNASTSVEPGSGSSVMAYAGICLTDDLQRHSDPYFSQRSQQEISTYTAGTQVAINEVQTASLRHFGGGSEVQVVTFGPGYQPTATIQPLSVSIGAVPSTPPSTAQLGGLDESGNTVTVSTGAAGSTHTLQVGDVITISGAGNAGYNGTWTVSTVLGTRAFQYINPTAGLPRTGGGTITLNAPGLSESGNSVTVRTVAAHGRSVGDIVVIAGAGVSGYNGTWVVDGVPSARSFTYTNPTAGLANSGGGTSAYSSPFQVQIGGNNSAVIGGSSQAYTSANIQAAINAISGFAGTVTVTGAASTGFTVAYGGASANTDVPNFSLVGLSCGGCFASVEETTHGGAFDSFKLNYNGTISTTTITNGTNYTAAGLTTALTEVLPAGATFTLNAFGGGNISGLNNTGFQVTFTGTLAGTDVPVNLAFDSVTAGASGWFGDTDQGGPDDRNGIVTATGNSFPTVNAGSDYTIPLRTPFTLTGSATDADLDPLIYTWEQNDRGGTAGSALLSNTKVDGPLFAMFAKSAQIDDICTLTYNCAQENGASTTPTRTLPDLQQIIDNNTNADAGVCPTAPIAPPASQAIVECYSEYLPTSGYTGAAAAGNSSPPRLDFRMSARDLKGGANFDDIVLTLAAGTGPFLVTSPNTLVSWESGSSQTVTWNVAGTDANGINTANVMISLSTDGGHTYPYVLNASTANDGSETVTIPNTNSTTARVKVEAVGNVFFDISNADFAITKAASSVSLLSSANPSVHGQGVTFTATVTSAGGTPTGTVQFAADGTPFGSAVPLVAGQATSESNSSLSTGSHNITATYSGDGGFSGSDNTSTPLVQVVNKADSSTAVSADVNPSVFGQQVTFTATVSASAPGSGTPTGTVQFKVDGSNSGGPVALNGVGQAQLQLSNLSVGTHAIAADYAGDGDFNISSGSQSPDQTVNKADTTTSITNGDDLGNATVVGQSYTVKWSVVVNAPGAGTPTGNVEVSGGSGCTADVSAGQCDVVSTASGSKNLVAHYVGDGNFNESTSPNGPHNVNLADTSVGLASNHSPSVHGQSVTFTATVTVDAPGSGNPTGTVQFKIDGSDFGSAKPVNGSGQATSDGTSSLSTAGHTISAVYSGDGNFNGSTSDAFTQTVNKANSSTALSSSANPSVHGQSVTFTATVTAVAPGAGTPTGLVQFKIDGSNFGSALALNGSGQATSGAISSLSTAGHTITVEYGGSSDFNTSNKNLTQTVNRANTTTTVSLNTNPSVHGQPVTFTAHVVANAPGAGTPNGTVQFKIDNHNVGSPVALNGAGQATSAPVSNLSTGTHTVKAVYAQSTNFNTSTSAGVTQTVNKSPSATSVSATPEPSRFGRSFTLKATIVASLPGAGVVKKGKVQFYVDGSKFRSPVKVKNGSASIVVNIALTIGNHSIQARFLGNGDFLASNSPIGTHKINP